MKYHVEYDMELQKNPYPGIFIAFEGLDASGKSTQAKQLLVHFEKQGKKVILKNPFEGEIGQFVRSILAGKLKIDPIAMQYLINAIRQSQQEEIKGHLKDGDIVILDRYIWSAPAYALSDKNLDFTQADALLSALDVLSKYNQFIMPNVTFYLKISPQTAMSRLDASEKQKEVLYENEKKLSQVTQAYDFVIEKFKDEFIIIDGEKSVEEVTEDIITRISNVK